MNTGSILAGRPSLGTWVNVRPGVRKRQPAGVRRAARRRSRTARRRPRNWGTGFMPGRIKGRAFRNGTEPILHLGPPPGSADAQQRRKLDLLGRAQSPPRRPRGGDSELDARIAATNWPIRMQAAAPEAVDLRSETAETRRLYGMDQQADRGVRPQVPARPAVGRARRAVRAALLRVGSQLGRPLATSKRTTASYAGRATSRSPRLLKDLKRRGLLDETLVIWGGEFGRTPMSEKGDGRDHNPYGFTMWLAGGGVKAGQVIGATDDFGLHAVEDRIHVHDLHATILELLGLDHKQLTYLHNGRPERPTINGGELVRGILEG